MPSKLFTCASVICLSIFTLRVQADNRSKPGAVQPAQIVCEVSDQDDITGVDRSLARLTIGLDGMGVATSVHIVRVLDKVQKSDFLADELDMKFDNVHHLITHAVQPNKVVDRESDGTLDFDWGIPRVEFIEASTEGGNMVSVAINDHTYAGAPGSTVTYKLNDKIYSSSSLATTFCKGRLKFPIQWPPRG